ncbi:MAG: phage major capsid protein [Clostridia bacterium]|nr:phage major capsid protein [Clostridia bacterium]
MENPDLKLSNEELENEMKEAIKSGDNEAQAKVMTKIMQYAAQEATRETAKLFRETNQDNMIMTARGAKLLTSEEKEYYSKIAKAIKAEQSLSNIEVAMPTTIIDRIFEDLVSEHPLLSKIDFQNVTGMIEVIVRTGDINPAWWGGLTDEIKKELSSGFEKKPANLYKLSAFLPIAKAHMDLGPAWLDTFIRKCIVEALSIGLEEGMVDGDGKEKPIGMNRNLAGNVVEGVYPKKEAIKITDLKPKTMGALAAKLTKDGKRAVTKLLMVVNPVDYLTKIFPATTVLNTNGTYSNNVLPFPTDVVQSPAAEKGKAIVGIAKKYFMGIGSTRKIESSEHYKFLEDETTYIGKMYGNGFPEDNDSFLLVDISELEEATLVAPIVVNNTIETPNNSDEQTEKV